MQLDRSDLELVLAIHEEGRLAAAARRLDLAPTVVSKRLAALERRVGARLVHRTTRRLQLSAEGEAFVALAVPLRQGFERLEQSLSDQQREPRGQLNVACSFGFGRVCLAPVLAQLHQAHPGIAIELHLKDTLPDLTGGRFDAAVWLWRPGSGSVVTRRLASNRRIVVAAPDDLARRGVPLSPDDLARHDCLVVRENDNTPALWRLHPAGRRGTPRTLRVQGPLSSNHGEVVRGWALAGLGLMLRSQWDVHAHLERGELVQVLPGWAMLDADVHLVLPPRDLRLATPRRLKLLQDHLVAAFARPPWTEPVRSCAPPATPPAP